MKWLTYGTITSKEIYTAIEKQEFYTVYQPVVNIQTLEIDHYECLARWDSTERYGYDVPPNIFTEVTTLEANRSLTQYIVNRALKDEQVLGKPVHVNLSYYDLFKMPTGLIQNVELVESYFASEAVPLLNKVTADKALWLDDVGAGASAWQHIPLLRSLKGIKLDAYLVKQVSSIYEDDACRKYISLISKIVEFCKDEDIAIVAECVETEVQHAIFRELKVDFGQGWFYHRPQPVEYWVNYNPSCIYIETNGDLY